MKTPNPIKNKNSFSRLFTCLSTLLSFNNTHCCQSRVDEGRMVAVETNENSRGGSGNGEESPTILVPKLTPQPVSTSVELTPRTQNWRFLSKVVEFVGNEGTNSIINNRKELIKLHNELFPASNSSSSTRGLYTPASSPQPLGQKSPPLIFINGPSSKTTFVG